MLNVVCVQWKERRKLMAFSLVIESEKLNFKVKFGEANSFLRGDKVSLRERELLLVECSGNFA